MSNETKSLYTVPPGPPCCGNPENCFRAYTKECADQVPASPLDKVPFMIVFDDADRPPELIIGKANAEIYYRRISMSWNAHLFVKIASNSRDEKRPSAQLAEPGTPGKPRLPFEMQDVELAALHRFYDCATDGEGYDVSDSMMRRLAEIGLLRRTSGKYFETTVFGLSVINGEFDIPSTTGSPAVNDPAPFDQWMHDRLFANPPLPVAPFDAWQAGRLQGQRDQVGVSSSDKADLPASKN